MIYIIADIHGCYNEYMELLDKIDFSDEDELYILGDVVDRGPEPIKVLQDMMMRPNVYPILGNHDYMALKMLKKLNVEINEDNVDSYLTNDDMISYLHWMQDGGDVTAKQFRNLSGEEKEDLLEYLQEFSLYEEIFLDNKRYILVHAGFNNFDEEKELDEYELVDYLFYRPDYNMRYFRNESTCLVTGHTPTMAIRQDGKPFIYDENGHLALDCGCVYGGKLAVYCLDNGNTFYVDKIEK